MYVGRVVYYSTTKETTQINRVLFVNNELHYENNRPELKSTLFFS